MARSAHAIVLTALVAALCSSACDPRRRSEIVDRVRVLAIQSEPASAQPGQTITLTALAVSKVRNDPDLQLVWYVCQYGSVDDCAKADDLTVIGQGQAVTVTVPPDAYVGNDVFYWLDAIRGGERERAVKGVPVRDPAEIVNNNPLLDRVRWSPIWPLTDIELMEVNQKMYVRISSSKMINEIWNESGSPASEDILVRTYTTGGELIDPSGSGASGNIYYKAPEFNGTYGAWVVINDGRGGVAWTERWFTVTGEKKPE